MASPTPIINGNIHFKRRVRDTGPYTLREQRKGEVITCLTWKLLSDSHGPQMGGDKGAITGSCAGPESRACSSAGGTRGAAPAGRACPLGIWLPSGSPTQRLLGHPPSEPSRCSRPRGNEAVLGEGPHPPGAKGLSDLFTGIRETPEFSSPEARLVNPKWAWAPPWGGEAATPIHPGPSACGFQPGYRHNYLGKQCR